MIRRDLPSSVVKTPGSKSSERRVNASRCFESSERRVNVSRRFEEERALVVIGRCTAPEKSLPLQPRSPSEQLSLRDGNSSTGPRTRGGPRRDGTGTTQRSQGSRPGSFQRSCDTGRVWVPEVGLVPDSRHEGPGTCVCRPWREGGTHTRRRKGTGRRDGVESLDPTDDTGVWRRSPREAMEKG